MVIRGQVRVGRKVDSNVPNFPGFTNIICLTKSSPYGDLSPYVLKDEYGHLLENVWQFAKVYEKVPRSLQRYSQWDPRIIWDHPEEIHCTKDTEGDNKLTLEYIKWRIKGFNNNDPVRYPVGYNPTHRQACIGSLWGEGEYHLDNPLKFLNYIEARKEIYLPIYLQSVQKEPKFIQLKERLEKGENLLIIEIDGPHQESLNYYKDQYGVNDSFIENNTILVNETNMNIMLNDAKHPFGHGYCLALALSS
jgi:hypothetical protein